MRSLIARTLGILPTQSRIMNGVRCVSSLHVQTDPKEKVELTRPRESSILEDTFGRHHSYLRISLTERCNLRCQYCMPAEGVDLAPQQSILTRQEIHVIAKLFVEAGVTKIRFTGGEPLVRKEIEEIVADTNQLRSLGLQTIAMTTNGIVLEKKLSKLLINGLDSLNISLDTMDPEKFKAIARRPGQERVLSAIHAALRYRQESGGKKPSVKVNTVLMRGVNESELLDFVEFTKEHDLEVRFIEYMPFDGNKWNNEKFMSYSDMLKIIQAKYPLVRSQEEANETAKTYHVPGFKGRVGFITSMSDHFCGTCNRLRMTADGNLKVCLFGNTEVSLRDAIRRGDDLPTLQGIVQAAVRRKKAKHAGMFELAKMKNRPMIKIGG